MVKGESSPSFEIFFLKRSRNWFFFLLEDYRRKINGRREKMAGVSKYRIRRKRGEKKSNYTAVNRLRTRRDVSSSGVRTPVVVSKACGAGNDFFYTIETHTYTLGFFYFLFVQIFFPLLLYFTECHRSK